MPSRILRALLIDTSEEALRHHPYLLLPRVDYFYHTWDDLAFGSNWFMLRKVYPEEINEWDPDPALKLRCLNVLWRRWTARLFNLQKFPPENINWNKDADLTFLYGPVCDPDPPLPFDHEPPPVNIVAATSHRPTRSNSTSGLKSVLKRPSSFINMLRAPASGPILSVPLQRSATDLAQYHRPNTLLLSSAPTSRCITPPSWAPPPPHPPPIYLSATKSADPLPQSLDRPRLRFNSRVEQCMVVFSDEEELLPTDIDDDDDDDDDDDTYVYDDSGHPERNLPNGSLLICSSDPSSEVPESQLCTKAAVPHDSLFSADEQPLYSGIGCALQTKITPDSSNEGCANHDMHRSPPARRPASAVPSYKRRRSRHSIIIKLEPTTLKGEDIRARKIPGALARTQSYYDAADIDDFDLGEFSDLVPDYNIVFSSAEDSRHHHSRNASDSGMFSLSPPSDGPSSAKVGSDNNNNNSGSSSTSLGSPSVTDLSVNYVQSIGSQLMNWIGGSGRSDGGGRNHNNHNQFSTRNPDDSDDDDDDISEFSSTSDFDRIYSHSNSHQQHQHQHHGSSSSKQHSDTATFHNSYSSSVVRDVAYHSTANGYETVSPLDEDDQLIYEWRNERRLQSEATASGRSKSGGSEQGYITNAPEKIRSMIDYYQRQLHPRRSSHHSHYQHYAGDKTSSSSNISGSIVVSSAVSPEIEGNSSSSESLLDVAEDNIVNTIEAIKWCTAFIANYTFF